MSDNDSQPKRGAEPRTAIYVVDRLEGTQVVLVRDADAVSVRVPRASLGPHADALTEGLVLRVPLDAAGHPAWAQAVADEQETERRMAEARARLDRLRRRDPGGDLEL